MYSLLKNLKVYINKRKTGNKTEAILQFHHRRVSVNIFKYPWRKSYSSPQNPEAYFCGLSWVASLEPSTTFHLQIPESSFQFLKLLHSNSMFWGWRRPSSTFFFSPDAFISSIFQGPWTANIFLLLSNMTKVTS